MLQVIDFIINGTLRDNSPKKPRHLRSMLIHFEVWKQEKQRLSSDLTLTVHLKCRFLEVST